MKIQISEIMDGKLSEEQTTALQRHFSQGGTWSALLKLSEAEVEEVYAIGHDAYVNGDFEKALSSFSILIQLDPYVPKHWVAVGAALQGKGEYSDALAAYELALSLEEKHVGALFYSAQCAYALDKKESAKAFLQKVKNSEQNEFTQKAELILGMIDA